MNKVIWDATESTENLAKRAKDLYYSRDQDELLAVPAEILEHCWRLVKTNFDEPAAKVLAFVNEAKLNSETEKTDELVELKKLLEYTIEAKSDFSRNVSGIIQTNVQPHYRRIAREIGLPENALNENPMGAIESCFFGEERDQRSHLFGGMMLTIFRVIGVDFDPTKFAPVLFAIREAYAYFKSDQMKTGNESLAFAEKLLATPDVNWNSEQKNIIGECFFATATAVHRTSDLELHERLVKRSIDFLPADGDSIANSLYYLGNVEIERGNVSEAMRMFNKAKSKTIADPILSQVIDTAVSMIRLEYESNIEQLNLGEGELSEFANIPPAMIEAMKSTGSKMMAGDLIEDSAWHRLAVAELEWIARRKNDPLEHKNILSSYVRVLSAIRSMGNSPLSFVEIASNASGFVDAATPSAAITFELLVLGHNVESGIASETTCEDLREVYSKFDSVDDPTEKLDLYQKFVLTLVVGLSRNDPNTIVPLATICKDLAKLFIEVKASLVTSESAIVARVGAEDTIRAITIIVFDRFGQFSGGSPEKMSYSTHLALSALNSDNFDLLRSYRNLLRASTNWMLGFYENEALGKLVDRLPENEQREFDRLNEKLAEIFAQSIFKIKFYPSKDKKVTRILDRLRELRLHAQFAQSAKKESSPANAQEDIVETFVLAVTPTPHEVLGAVSFSQDYVHLWCSMPWTKLLHQIEETVDESIASNTNAISEKLNRVGNAIQNADEFRMAVMLGNKRTSSRITFSNLTGLNLPFQALADPEYKYSIFTQCGKASHLQRVSAESISYWSPATFVPESSVVFDNTSRAICLRESKKLIAQFPQKGKAAVSDDFVPPLVYSAYERWYLDELGSSRNVKVDINFGNDAMRHRFLNQKLAPNTMLHVSTHGFVHDEVAETAQLMFSCRSDVPERAHFSDILSRDWSNVSLVFLNACSTQAGKKRVGESSLSLAWAFLAGGAKSVIATRWPIPDYAAWLFAKHFYDCWFSDVDAMTIESAFRQAQKKLLKEKGCDKLNCIGAFVLIR